jgi:hypothetical protein
MDKARKTEIIDNHLWEALKKLHDEYKGEIQFSTDSDYNVGRIVIKVKE